MKFELPSDMILVSDSRDNFLDVSNGYDKPVSIIASIERRRPKEISIQDAVTEMERNFQALQVAIEDFSDKKSEARALQRRQEHYEENWRKINSDARAVQDEIQARIKAQNEEVNALIRLEIKKRRAEEEERKRKLEEKRKIEEERKRKEIEQRRLEEDRLRKEEARRKAEEKARAEKQRLDEENKRKEIERKKQLEDEEKKLKLLREESEKKKKEEEKERLQKLQEKKKMSTTDFARVKQDFLKYKQAIADIKKDVVEPVATNPELKKQISALRRKINPKFGQLSHSQQQWNKINHEIIQLITLAQSQDLAFKWILNFVAKAVVDQAETEVTVQAGAAIPLARLAYSLVKQFPDLEYFLTARFVKKCPFIIGFSRTVDTEEGRLQMGWKRNNNKWEDDVKYDERVSGICTVWATMSRIEEFGPQVKFFSYESSWTFLARLMNTDAKLLHNVHYSIAANWWEAAGFHFMKKYGNQSRKLMLALSREWVALVEEKKFPAATRLNILGEDWVLHGKVATLGEMER